MLDDGLHAARASARSASCSSSCAPRHSGSHRWGRRCLCWPISVGAIEPVGMTKAWPERAKHECQDERHGDRLDRLANRMRGKMPPDFFVPVAVSLPLSAPLGIAGRGRQGVNGQSSFSSGHQHLLAVRLRRPSRPADGTTTNVCLLASRRSLRRKPPIVGCRPREAIVAEHK